MSMDEAGCIENPNDPRCSCYNVILEDCNAKPNLPGCKEGKAWEKQILDVIPDTEKFSAQKSLAARELALRYHCTKDVCGDDKYKPPEYEDYKQLGRCDFNLNICASDVQVGETINSKYFRDCTIRNVDYSDLDAAYDQDPSVQAILGIRTAENASLIASENKKYKLKLRAEERRKKAEEAAIKAALESDRIQQLEEDVTAQKDKRDTIMTVISGVSILLIIWILNV